jgi:hypothetical protein
MVLMEMMILYLAYQRMMQTFLEQMMKLEGKMLEVNLQHPPYLVILECPLDPHLQVR